MLFIVFWRVVGAEAGALAWCVGVGCVCGVDFLAAMNADLRLQSRVSVSWNQM